MKDIKIKETSCSGIYKITNIINSKFYIGSSVNIYYRIKLHLSQLKRKIHGNIYLQRSFNKYSIDAFKVEILKKCDKSKLRELEEYYIRLLKPDYNMVSSTYISPVTEELKSRISNTLKRKYKSGEIKKVWNKDAEIPLKVYNCLGEFLFEENSINSCARKLKLNKNTLKSKIKDGYYWCNQYMIIKKSDNLEDVVDKYLATKMHGENLTNLPVLFIVDNIINIYYKTPLYNIKPLIFKNNFIYRSSKSCTKFSNIDKGYFTFMGLYARVKSDKLLEHPEEDNQQPIIILNE